MKLLPTHPSFVLESSIRHARNHIVRATAHINVHPLRYPVQIIQLAAMAYPPYDSYSAPISRRQSLPYPVTPVGYSYGDQHQGIYDNPGFLEVGFSVEHRFSGISTALHVLRIILNHRTKSTPLAQHH